MGLIMLKQEREYFPTEWQEFDLNDLLNPEREYPSSANWSQMGCVVGSTKVATNRAGKGKTFSVAEMYDRLHSDWLRADWRWDEEISTYVRAFVDGRIRQHRLLDVIYQGKKPVLTIKLENTARLTCTFDHKIMLADGRWEEAGNLQLGDSVMVQGGFSHKEPPQPMWKNESRGDGSFYDKDGYVRVWVPGHPRANHSNHVYEHIIVMENHLERVLKDSETVHHINENKNDNRISNLELKDDSIHKSDHAKSYLGTYMPVPMKITAMWNEDDQDVYDLVMEAPWHNFVANGIVVHNCYKTTTGLWLAERYAEAQKIENPNILIITTKSGKGTYRDAIPKSLPQSWRTYNVSTKDANILMPFGMEKKYDLDYFYDDLTNPQRPQIILAHYHVFVNKSPMWKLLGLVKWDAIIVDEAHRMKNRETQWTRNIKQLEKSLGHVMTGTGFINDPSEIWSLLNFLDRARFSSYWKFREHFCEEEDFTGFRKVVGINPENRGEFRELRKNLGPRRTMAEVHPDIDEPIFTPLEIELNPTQRRMYNEIKKQLRALDQQGEPIHSPNVLSQLQRLRQICVATPEKVRDYFDPKTDRRVQEIRLVEPSSKLDALMEVIDGLQWDEEEKQQLVVFSNFKDPLELARVRFERAGISYIWMQEKDNEATRYQKWHDVFPQKKHRVFMCTLQLGSESINLSPAQHAVFLDRSWSPKDNNQGVGRLYRPGQTGQTNIIHINALKTNDQRMLATHNEKTGWFTEIFGEED